MAKNLAKKSKKKTLERNLKQSVGNDRHYVRSRAELVIANWLFAEGIAYAYEKRVPIKEDVYCYFYIPKGKVYIEFWGYEDDEAYLERKEKKIELYKKYNLNLIEIDNDKIGNLDDHLPKELLRFCVSLNL
ncbi:helicase IV [Campylobacter concisus]